MIDNKAPIVNYCYAYALVKWWDDPKANIWSADYGGIPWNSTKDVNPGNANAALYIQAANTDMDNENDGSDFDTYDHLTDIWIRVRIPDASKGALVQGLQI
jgi:hypothetical protein